PFQTEEEWELARWLVNSGTSQNKIKDFLQLPLIQKLDLSYKNVRSLLKRVDGLPKGPEWHAYDIVVEGDKLNENGSPEIETVELYSRDILECIQDILGDPELRDSMTWSPQRVWSDEEKKNRFYSEM
ncbi:hypothetical protein SISSUDRAFT_971931, partial [Sistotremastrum suecicum HHB10207 ss-3]